MYDGGTQPAAANSWLLHCSPRNTGDSYRPWSMCPAACRISFTRGHARERQVILAYLPILNMEILFERLSSHIIIRFRSAGDSFFSVSYLRVHVTSCTRRLAKPAAPLAPLAAAASVLAIETPGPTAAGGVCTTNAVAHDARAGRQARDAFIVRQGKQQ